MYDSLIEGKRYKVRLRPKEELEELVSEGRLQACWFKEYMDGQVGVLHYDSGKPIGSEHKVFWRDNFWYYRLECLKVLGELD